MQAHTTPAMLRAGGGFHFNTLRSWRGRPCYAHNASELKTATMTITTSPLTNHVQTDQALDDFCADAIREMRGMASFNPMRDNGNARRGRNKAACAFARKLHKSFPSLTDQEVRALGQWAYERARNWSMISTATEALRNPKRV